MTKVAPFLLGSVIVSNLLDQTFVVSCVSSGCRQAPCKKLQMLGQESHDLLSKEHFLFLHNATYSPNIPS